MLAKSEPHYF